MTHMFLFFVTLSLAMSSLAAPAVSKKPSLADFQDWTQQKQTGYLKKFASPTVTHHVYLPKVGEVASIDLNYQYPRFVISACENCRWVIARVAKKMIRLRSAKGPDLEMEIDKETPIPGQQGLFVSASYYEQDDTVRLFLYDLNQKTLGKKRLRQFAPYNKKAVAPGKFQWLQNPELVTIQRSDGSQKQISKVARIDYQMMEKKGSLSVYNFSGNDDYKKSNQTMLLFRDYSNGKQTYGAGRFLDIDFGVPMEKLKNGHPVWVDFNFSYNPPCAVSTGFHCPLPQDMVKVEFIAGELYKKIN